MASRWMRRATSVAVSFAALVGVCVRLGGESPPPARSSFDAALIAKGAELAAIGNCISCHTAPRGKPFAGGRALKTPFGTLYGTNITPDPDTGIGRWSEADFRRALREGLDREGRHLFPAFPYDHFTKVTDEDVRALYAYVMTRDAVRAENRPHELTFPFNVRSLVGVWKARYFEPGVFKPDPARDAQWNRGAYLVEGLGHCGACHTPRNALGAEKRGEAFAGGEAEGWHAPALNADSPAPVPWTTQQLYVYLRTGLEDTHAIAAGPMAPVVHNLATVPESEVRAIAAYFTELTATPARERGRQPAATASGQGAAIYEGACAGCHDQGRGAGNGAALHLAQGTAMTLPTSKNLIRITLHGITPPEGESGRMMPGFAELTDSQVQELVAYIREQFGRAPPWNDVDAELKKAREER